MTTVIIVIAALLIVYLIGAYNSLVRLRNYVKESWAQIDTLLKRRYDLIPNLIETVKGYMKYEEKVLTEIVQARGGLVSEDKSEAIDAMAALSVGAYTPIPVPLSMEKSSITANVLLVPYPNSAAD
jgi:LemA protein